MLHERDKIKCHGGALQTRYYGFRRLPYGGGGTIWPGGVSPVRVSPAELLANTKKEANLACTSLLTNKISENLGDFLCHWANTGLTLG